MKKISFEKISTDEEIEKVSKIADKIWHEYFPKIITTKQIDYMVELFLSPKSIKEEIKAGYEFFFVNDKETIVGFTVIRQEDDKFFISKLYIDKEFRGTGYGSGMIEQCIQITADRNLKSMYLTVNKNNTASIDIYKHKGFEVIDSVVNDIGNGFVMDDYIMERKVTKKDIAQVNFKKGYNCSQALCIAFAEEMDMDKDTIARITSSFGAGMGRMREVCGAVSGMFMVAGNIFGYEDPKAHEEKAEHYERVQYLASEFKKENGSIICKELLGLEKKEESVIPEKRTEEYYKKRPCVELVGEAAEILEKYILENKLKITK